MKTELIFTEPKTLVYPGAHGQVSYCKYQIALSVYLDSPQANLLLWHEDGYTGTTVVNNGRVCDNAVNRILKDELFGICMSDVKIFYQWDLGRGTPVIHTIPFQVNWKPDLSWGQKILLKMGFRLKLYPNPEQEKCGNSPVITKDNIAISQEESSEIVTMFNLPKTSNKLTKRELA